MYPIKSDWCKIAACFQRYDEHAGHYYLRVLLSIPNLSGYFPTTPGKFFPQTLAIKLYVKRKGVKVHKVPISLMFIKDSCTNDHTCPIIKLLT